MKNAGLFTAKRRHFHGYPPFYLNLKKKNKKNPKKQKKPTLPPHTFKKNKINK